MKYTCQWSIVSLPLIAWWKRWKKIVTAKVDIHCNMKLNGLTCRRGRRSQLKHKQWDHQKVWINFRVGRKSVTTRQLPHRGANNPSRNGHIRSNIRTRKYSAKTDWHSTSRGCRPNLLKPKRKRLVCPKADNCWYETGCVRKLSLAQVH